MESQNDRQQYSDGHFCIEEAVTLTFEQIQPVGPYTLTQALGLVESENGMFADLDVTAINKSDPLFIKTAMIRAYLQQVQQVNRVHAIGKIRCYEEISPTVYEKAISRHLSRGGLLMRLAVVSPDKDGQLINDFWNRLTEVQVPDILNQWAGSGLKATRYRLAHR